jgi:hypothetical protein
VLRNPLLDFDRKDVILQLWLEPPKQVAKLGHYVSIQRKPLPMLTLSVYTGPPAHQIKVCPATAHDLGAS